MRLLQLTSPLTHGEDVKLAQKHLAGDNVFGHNFHPGKADGQFGETTGAACVRAKAFLGYATDQIHPSYGDELNGYLTGTSIPLRFQLRKKRLPAALTIQAKALAAAVRFIGLKEDPAGSNHQRFGEWYGADGQPWCAMFVSYCYSTAGSKAFQKGKHYAYVPYVVNDARAGRNGLSVVRNPLAGDLVCYDWQGNGVADHIGIYEANSGGGKFHAVEGNTAVGNDSNGGEVMRRLRMRSQVQAFVRVSR